MTNSIEDICRDAQVIMLVGSNPEEAHPVLGMQVRAAVERGCRLIVVDPREIGLSKRADVQLRVRPGTNVALANGMLNVILRDGLVNKEFVDERTEGFEQMRAVAEQYPPEKAAAICNIPERDLVAAAHLYAQADRAAILYCLGVAEHSTGTDGVMSLSNLAMATGHLGRRGCGVNPIRGQNNVQGACDMGGSPDVLPGYQKVANPDVRAKFSAAWGVDIPEKPGMKSTEVLPAAIRGDIHGLFIFGEDPVRTDPDTAEVEQALEALDFLVVDELFLTDTAKFADVVLPGRSYAEKEGTFTNTERRVQRVRRAVTAEGDMRLDTDIFTDVMNRMGYPQPRLTSAQLMDEMASLTPSYGGMSHTRLDAQPAFEHGLQWPCPKADGPDTPVMHVGKFARGLGLFAETPYRPSGELPDEEYPFVMMTGRILYQYNARAMTGRTHGLDEMGGESFIEVNTQDAERLGIADGERVRVSSRRGQVEVAARVSRRTNPGETWMPLHYREGNCNVLTSDFLDPVAKVPEYKVCAVKIEKA